MPVPDILGGRYELRGVLGRGGMAEVRDGWDLRLHRAVAIKLLNPAFSSANAEQRRRFEAEARSAAALNHPNIVAVHDTGDYNGVPYIVMERLPGRTLADDIALGPIPERTVRRILGELLGALAAAHDAGILHRDIKPANILFTTTGAVKLTDFGIAKTRDADHTRTGQIVGTLAYVSPDRLYGRPAAVTDDLYAVGVVGYEALTGRRPYLQNNPAAMARAISDGPPPPLETVRPGLDPTLTVAIGRAMAHDRDLRFTDARTMLAALAAPPEGAPVPQPAPRQMPIAVPPAATLIGAPAPDPSHRTSPRTRTRILAVIAAVVAILAALTYALATAGQQEDSPTPGTTTETVVPASAAPPTTPASIPVPVAPVEPPANGNPQPDNGNGNGQQKEKEKKEKGNNGPP
ncbi:protein kinase [Aldersonia sp. NBC_00410]|uniref:serine/threonine-protein kinase n=1 Tax=Aldersonia sp. NBC_00410 TaxID=2975954 RepID=UPI0022598BC7|nr:serine/threonine-protein kinase [Aldersonia sp. NBC_00410]MCX5042059.1 protein kinase [Aldersonia sp. NBC_00410]